MQTEISTEYSGFKDAKRVHESFLASRERVCLDWLVCRLPSWVHPDHLTVLGLAAMFFAGICYALAYWWPPFLLAVNFWIAVNWFGDSLDGTLARLRNQQRPRYGFYVDHIADVFGAFFLAFGLVFSRYISVVPAAALLVSSLMLGINAYLAAYSMGMFRLSAWKFGPTEMRVILMGVNLCALAYPVVHLFGEPRLLFDVVGVIMAISMAIILIFSVVRNTVSLYRAEKF